MTMRINQIMRGIVFLSFVTPAYPPMAQAADCVGNMPLTLTETQGGFAGTTGTIWTIQADCSFTIARVINASISEPHQRGQLNVDQQARLSRLLAEKPVESLPAELGSPAPVNRHQIILKVSGKTSVLDLPPGPGGIERVKSGGDDATKRLVEIFETVKALTGGSG